MVKRRIVSSLKAAHAPVNIAESHQHLNSIEHLKEVLDALPYLAAILNHQNQIVYSNGYLLKELGGLSIEQVLGKRPGEALKCENTQNGKVQCGTADKCRYCGAYQAITQSVITQRKQQMECRIITSTDNNFAYDFSVTATPITWKNEDYIILSLKDISDQKRRETLERIFYHDILNRAGSLSGYLELLKDVKNPEKARQFLEIAGIINEELIEEVMSHRQLVDAENNRLSTSITSVLSTDLLHSIRKQLERNQVAYDKQIVVDAEAKNIMFDTDQVIIKRILINMIKNALESTTSKGSVYTGCFHDNGKVTFWVKNQQVIPDDIQKQIFQRSFSTKGKGRGLGTYSIKLLGEHYLKGKTWFTSENNTGTTFFIELPIQPTN